MTQNELNDYCLLYWQDFSKEALELMKDFPCVYRDAELGMHSLTYGNDYTGICALSIDPSDKSIYIFKDGYKFYPNYVRKNDCTYGYDDIDNSKLFETFVEIILFLAKYKYEILNRMRGELSIIKEITITIGL